jgi:enoyl-CoA hydratase/carnithine racemase
MIDVIDHGSVREVRMNRPPANALDRALLQSLRDALEAAPADGARAVVLSGAPGIFTGGLDVPYLIGLDRAELEKDITLFFSVMRTLAASPLPVVAAITGHCPAGGAVLALFCDRRVMAEGDYIIGLNEVQVGIVVPRFIAVAITRLVGARRAAELCVTGALVSPQQALDDGLVDEVAPAETVVGSAIAWCERLLELPPRAMQGTRECCRFDLVQAFDAHGGADTARMVAEWFEPSNQQALRALVRRLTGRR